MFRNLLGGGERGNPGERRVYPTTFRRPLWVRPITLRTAINKLRVSDFKVKHISPTFEKGRGLMRSPLSLVSEHFSGLPITLNPEELMAAIREAAPTDGVEVVEWMHIAYADAVVMQARIAEYNRLGSQTIGHTGDGYCPGVYAEDIRLRGTLGRTVRTQGYDVATTPRGNFRIPSLGKSSGIFRDLISWGSMSYLGSVQTSESLLKWKSLAETPIRETVGFYRDRGGNVAPNFFVQIPARPALSINVRQKFSSDKDQTLDVKFRDPTNYSRVIGDKSVAVATGTSDVTYTVSAFPYVPPVVAEIQPEDETQIKLEEFVVA